MKRCAQLLLVLLLIALTLNGCACVERVSPEEFEELALRVGKPESLFAHSFIGQTDKRSYIEQWSSSNQFCRDGVKIFWIPNVELLPVTDSKVEDNRVKNR